MPRDKENYNAWMRAWRAKNREKVKATTKRWKKANPDKVRAQWKRRDPEKEKARQAAKFQRNKEKVYEYTRAYVKANPEKRRKWEADKKAKNPEYIKRKTRRLWAKTVAEMEAIAGRPRPDHCENCGRKGRTFFDHCHRFKAFRGWLCHGCNTALGFMEDNWIWLRKLADYAESHYDRLSALEDTHGQVQLQGRSHFKRLFRM